MFQLQCRFVMAQYIIVAFLFVAGSGCNAGGLKDDPKVVKALKKIGAISDRDVLIANEHGGGHILSLNLTDKDISEVLPHLEGLGGLEGLDINVRDYSAEEITPLGKLKSLRSLKIYCASEHIPVIAGLTNLERLDCPKNGITDDSLKYLADMKKMEKLSLEGNPISGEGLKYLEGFSELRVLHAQRTDFNDAAIPYLVNNFPNLTEINLRDTKVTAEGMLELSELHFLNHPELPTELSRTTLGGLSSEERKQALRQQDLAKKQFMIEYLKRYVASKEQAKTAGEKVPPDDYYPFAGTVSLSDLDTRREQ